MIAIAIDINTTSKYCFWNWELNRFLGIKIATSYDEMKIDSIKELLNGSVNQSESSQFSSIQTHALSPFDIT